MFLALMEKIAKAGDEYIQTHAGLLAMGKVMAEREHVAIPLQPTEQG